MLLFLRRRISSSSTTWSYPSSKGYFIGVSIAFISTWAVNKDQLVNGSFKKTSFFPDWVTRRTTFRTSLLSLGQTSVTLARTGFITNEANIANFVVGANVFVFISDVSVVAHNRELKHRRFRGDGDVYSRGKPGVEAAVDTIESRRLSKRGFHDGNVFETFIKTLKKLPKMPSKKSLLLQFFGKEKNRDTEFLVWEEIN